MAGKGISIDIGANTREFQGGVKDVEKSLDDVADALDDLTRDSGRSADKAGDNLADGIEDGARDSEKAVEKLERSFKELSDAATRESSDAGDAIGRNVKKGTADAEEGLDDFKQEANQTAKESAASFDGSAESIIDVFQEVAANAFAGFGPAGAVAGLAAAVGIGFAVSAIEGGAEDTEAFKERVGELTQQFIDAGGTGKRTFDDLVSSVQDLATETDDSKDQLKDLKKIAETVKMPLDAVVKAYLEGGPALDTIISKNEDLQRAEQERYALAGDKAGGMKADLGDQISLLKNQKTAIEEAQQAELDYLQSGASEFEVKKGMIENIDSAYDNARDSAGQFWDEETNSFDLSGWIAYVEEHKGLVEQYKGNLELMKLSPEQWANFLELPEDAQMSIASSWATGDAALRSSIASTLTDGAGNAGTDAAVAFDDSFKPQANVDIDVDTDPVQNEIEAVADAKYEATIKVKSTGKAATKDAIDAVAKTRTATIKAVADTSNAEAALNRLENRARSVQIRATVVDRNGREIL